MTLRTVTIGALVLAVATAIALGVAVWAVGLVGYERHSGFLAPVWSHDGNRIYVVRRESAGFFWGPGWEFFTSPATVLVTRDRYELLRLDPATGEADLLQQWDSSPLVGRRFHEYHGRIFGIPGARLEPIEGGVEVLLGIAIPHEPYSQEWSIHGRWTTTANVTGDWGMEPAGNITPSDAVLRSGQELITIPGPQGFDAAVLIVDEENAVRAIAGAPSFEHRYRHGVPDELVAERSRWTGIEGGREFVRVQQELETRFRQQGLSAMQATLRAYDEMETLGYLQRSPRLVATPIEEPGAHLDVFELPGEYLRVGFFQDIAAAIAQPGSEVKADTGDHLQYKNDTVGPRLRAYRDAGNERFVIKLDGRFYLMETTRWPVML